MIRRLLLVACATVCCLQAQLRLYLLQDGSEAPVTDQYGFGTLSLGDFRDIPFRLRNVGTGSTRLTVLTLGGPEFSFVIPPAVPQTVPAGAAVDVTVRFKASQPGTSEATFAADGVSVIFHGSVLSAATISVDAGGGAWHVLAADATIDFGKVMRGSTTSHRIKLTNPGGGPLIISHVAVAYLPPVPVPPASSPFEWTGVALPVHLAPGASAILKVAFAPTTNGTQDGWAFEVEQRLFKLVGAGIDPPFPKPEIVLDIGARSSARQGSLTVRLAAPSQATGMGTAEIEMHAKTATANRDSGIMFLAAGSGTAAFSVKPGDTVGRFASEDSVAFQTGTTAGDLVFTVKLGDFTETRTLSIAPGAIFMEPPTAQRTSAGLDLRINGYDNTRSASKLTFQFFDQSGKTLAPGAMTLDSATVFQQFFGSSDLGGMFALRAFFPVIGNPKQVDSVTIEMVNSTGTSRTGPIRFVTP